MFAEKYSSYSGIGLIPFLLLSLWLPLASAAQTTGNDTVLKIEEVVISDTRLAHFSDGIKIQSFDSASLQEFHHKTLADLLTDETGLFIKTYGLGSLATSSFRGGSANHTLTLWNGFNINSPMNGLLDFSLIPAGLSNSVKIQHGGTSALWGSGAIGGTIHLNSVPVFNRGLTASASFEAGSFRTFQERLTFEISKRRWISGLKFSHASAKNNFLFRNYYMPDSPELRQTNAELRQYSLLSENFFMINKKQKLNLFFWHQKTDRNLPPTLLQTMAHSSQKDESYRVTSEWQFSEVRKQFFIRAAYFDENITYADTVYDFSAYSRSQSLIAEAEAKAAVGSIHFLNAGVNNTFVRALSESAGLPDGYPHRPQRNHLALFASYKLVTLNKKYSLTISARQELLEKEFMPFTFSAGTDLKITKWLTAIASVARVYRVPTFNDLFWTPGGNPDLLAENGFSEDAGLSVFARSKKQNFSFTFEPTFFNRNIEAWIIWLPAGNYWTPQNIMKVWSRGVETNTVFTYQCKKTKFTLSALANYVISTNEQSKTANDASLGKQLIYVPIFTLRAKFSVEYKGYALVYRHGFTSARYTATDNSESLPAFDLASIRLSKEFNVKSWRLSVFADIENLFNKEYQAILIRPMPGRSYSGGIALQFNQPFSNHKTLQP